MPDTVDVSFPVKSLTRASSSVVQLSQHVPETDYQAPDAPETQALDHHRHLPRHAPRAPWRCAEA